jgi:hypothetical protein
MYSVGIGKFFRNVEEKTSKGVLEQGTQKRRPLLQTSSPANNEQPKPNSMARVSFKSVSPRGVTPRGQSGRLRHKPRHKTGADEIVPSQVVENMVELVGIEPTTSSLRTM